MNHLLILTNEYFSRSIFEGASKYEILHYLRDAKDRIGASSSCSGEIDPSSSLSNNDDTDEPLSRVQTPNAAIIPGEPLRRNQGCNSIALKLFGIFFGPFLDPF